MLSASNTLLNCFRYSYEINNTKNIVVLPAQNSVCNMRCKNSHFFAWQTRQKSSLHAGMLTLGTSSEHQANNTMSFSHSQNEIAKGR